MKNLRRLTAVALAGVLLAGCGDGSMSAQAPADATADQSEETADPAEPDSAAQPTDTPSDSETPAPTPAGDALRLVNIWRVGGPAPVDDQTWVRFDQSEYVIWTESGGVAGGWMAADSAFLASQINAGFSGGDMFMDVTWLTSAVAYEFVGDEVHLTDAAGETTAILRIDGQPEPQPDTIDWMFAAPTVTDAIRNWLAAPAPLPEALAAATDEQLTGRWIPQTTYPTDPFLDFAADGTWTGSDGCNGNNGAWRLDEGGRILATGGFSTLMWCEGEQLPSLLTEARRLGFDGDELVLVDGTGSELVRLIKG